MDVNLRSLIKEVISESMHIDQFGDAREMTTNYAGWSFPKETFASRVKGLVADIIMEEEGISEKNFTGVDQAIREVRRFFEHSEPARALLSELEQQEVRHRYAAEVIYRQWGELDKLRDDDGIARQNEGWGRNLAFAGAVALSGLGGVKAQSDPQGTEIQASHHKGAHSAAIGYINGLSQRGTDKSPEQIAAMKEARIHFENLRDGKQTIKPSHGAKVVIDYVLEELQKMSGQQLKSLSNSGMNVHTSVNESDRQKLRDDQVKLTDEERAEVIVKGAVWRDGTPGIWKSVDKDGNAQYCSNTHRAMAVSTTLADAIKKFPEIEATS